MKRAFFVLFFLVLCWSGWAKESINPTITPSLFRYNDPITIKYDVTGTPLASLTNAYLWIWIPNENIDAKYNINPASGDPTKTNNAKFTKVIDGGKTYFTITITPSLFFAGDISSQTQVGMLLKGNDWTNGQTVDYITDFWDGSFQIKLNSPSQQPLFVNNAEQISIQAETPVTADYDLYIDNVLTDEQDGITSYSYTHTVTETSGRVTVKVVASTIDNSSETTFQYIISVNSTTAQRPAGIIPGINYDPNDNTKATLCLWAPGKTSVYALGDFTDWDVTSDYLMYKDGEYFWIDVTGLTPGVEYGFKYLVNESLFIADPYADKILDTDDQYIPSTSYPNLKPYPSKAVSPNWYFNRVSIIQTDQEPYVWQAEGYQKPVKENLVVYELLIRDFFASNERTYQNLIDTISYFKRLGVNAIELMPIMEFNGNESWGYNPAFMFAPDKYYGPKNKLKEFVDKCHQNDIAVILDIAMNHQDLPNPYVMMDFDFVNYKPTVNNKWFNVTATHPYSVFYDMNHESAYTKKYLDTINYYWLNEYKVDGFRFDLSKGFTQTNNPDNVNAWGAYDASRIAILKRMSDKIWEHSPEAIVILEHFADNTEEKELAAYRADEGKGMMLWGNLNNAYNQNTMGFAANSDIKWIYHGTRTWSVPHVVGYMESHDEERLMYKNLNFGNMTDSYSVKNMSTALNRVKAATVLFYTIPGPKMLWEFGELGYDQSINRCDDGSINSNCRVTAKPVKWEYLQDPARLSLFNHTADLIKLKNTYSVFSNGNATFEGANALLKQMTLKNEPYTSSPASAEQMNVQVAVNFDMTSQSILVSFPHTGSWFDYYGNGEEINVTATPFVVSLKPGEYKLYTDVAIDHPIVTAIETEQKIDLVVYPNPVHTILQINSTEGRVEKLTIRNMQGAFIAPHRINENQWDVKELPAALYIGEVKVHHKTYRIKIIKN
jgi:1,4-alpha-glucan branching enzyme